VISMVFGVPPPGHVIRTQIRCCSGWRPLVLRVTAVVRVIWWAADRAWVVVQGTALNEAGEPAGRVVTVVEAQPASAPPLQSEPGS
jgi:hypothetical protein